MKSTFPRAGELVWIGLSPGRRQAIQAATAAVVEIGTGLVGDRHAQTGKGERQVTLIQAEHLPVIAGLAGHDEVTPEMCRRNLVVRGINLRAMRKSVFRVGEVVLRGTGTCAPCGRMEENLGPGGYNAMRGHGGITATVISGGTVRVGDAVTFEATAPAGRDPVR